MDKEKNESFANDDNAVAEKYTEKSRLLPIFNQQSEEGLPRRTNTENFGEHRDIVDLKETIDAEKASKLDVNAKNLTGCSNERFEKRRQKILKYIDKKHRRYNVESEKVKEDRFYEVRRKVADRRLRVKGRFVTHSQAIKMLGLTE